MSRADISVNICAVRLIADGIDRCAESLENVFAYHPGRAIRAVKPDFKMLKGINCKGDEISDRAISACGVVNALSDIVARSEGEMLKI